MYCRSCGNQLNEGQAFCDKCGVRADGADGPGPQHVIHLREKSEGIAAVLSFLWAGVGQLYLGKTGRGLLLLFFYILLTVIAIVVAFRMWDMGNVLDLWIMSILLSAVLLALRIWNTYDAYKLAKEYNDHLRSHGKRPW